MKKQFDLNTLIGFFLIGGILLFYGYFYQPKEAPSPEGQSSDSTTAVSPQQAAETLPDSPPAANADTLQTGPDSLGTLRGPFVQVSEPGMLSLENDLLALTFQAQGGQLQTARLKKYQTYDSLPLRLIDQSASFNLPLSADERYFSADLNFTGRKLNDSTLEYRLETSDGGVLYYRYVLPKGEYMLQWQLRTEGMARYFPAGEGQLTWEMKLLRQEKNLDNERTMTELEYRNADDNDVDRLNGSGLEEEQSEDPLRWIAFKQQFFSTILLGQSQTLQKAKMLHDVLPEEGYTKFFASQVSIPALADGNLNAQFGLYLGPNKYELLKAYDQDFEALIPLGWGIFGWINRGLVLPIFDWLETYGLNYGLIILIIALIFKLILFPLTYQSYRSMAKMRVLKPEMDELNDKYKDKDPMKKQQAVMELYQKAGVNPLGGCLPMLLQLPILIALFRFFPASIELRQQSFLWADDLSTYDSIFNLPFEIPFYGDHVSLFTLLMTVSTLIYTYMNQQLTGSAQNQQLPQMKYIIYLMPLVFLGVFNNYAAGLSYYYFVANMITFGQQFAIRAFIDDDKIHARIQEKKKQPKKENRLMRRMKEVQEQQNQNRQMRRRSK